MIVEPSEASAGNGSRRIGTGPLVSRSKRPTPGLRMGVPKAPEPRWGTQCVFGVLRLTWLKWTDILLMA